MSTRALSGRLALSLVLIAAFVSVSVFVFKDGQASVTERPAESPAEHLASVLASKVDLNFKETPLTDVVDSLKAKHGIEIHIDNKALTEANVALDTQLTLEIKGISLRSALQLLLRQADLKMLPKEDVLWITTRDVYDDFCETRVYEVLDLVVMPGADRLDTSAYNFIGLIDILQNILRPDAWNATGGPGSIERLPNAAALVVSANPELQIEISELLALLRHARDQQLTDGNLKPLAQRSLASIRTHTTAAPAIRKVLGQKINFDENRAPLNTLLNNLADKWKIPLFLDVKSLSEANIAVDVPVSLRAKASHLGVGLNMLLEPHGLRWMISDEVLFVTTKDMADDATVARIFPVSDFEDDGDAGSGRRPVGIDSLINVVQNSVKPDSWSETGGPGMVEYFPIARCLVFRQIEQVQEEIERLVASLRLARIRQMPPQPAPVAAEVNNDTLVVKIYWPPRSMMPHRGLIWGGGGGGGGGMGGGGWGGGGGYFSVNDQSGSPSNTAPPAKAATTDVPGTVLPQTGLNHPIFQAPVDAAPELAKIIPQMVEPESWKEAGGKGAIQALQGRLIVRQTNQVHAQIAKFLRELQ